MKVEDLIPLCGTCSALPGNLSLYPGDAKWSKLLIGVIDRNHLLLTSVIPGELHGMKEVFLKDKLAGDKAAVHETTILKAKWCKLQEATFLVLCSTSGFQICEEEGAQPVFTYSFKDDDCVDEAKWEYAASVANVNNLIFVGFRLYSNTKWKGGTMRLEMAKESFMERLKREREQNNANAADGVVNGAVVNENAGISDVASRKIVDQIVARKTKGPEGELKVVSFLSDDEDDDVTGGNVHNKKKKKTKEKEEEKKIVESSSKTVKSKKKEPATPSPDAKNDGEESDDSGEDHDGIPAFRGLSSIAGNDADPAVAGLFAADPSPTPEKKKVEKKKTEGQKIDVPEPAESTSASRKRRSSAESKDVAADASEDVRKKKKKTTEKKTKKEGEEQNAESSSTLANRLESFAGSVWNCDSDPHYDQEMDQMRKRSEKARVAKLRELSREMEKRKKILSVAVYSSLDSGNKARPNKKIVFDDDGEEKKHEEEKPEAKGGSAKRRRLLDDDEDGDDDSGLLVREEFLGDGGEELLALESTYGADERFKLNARFLSDGANEDGELRRPLPGLATANNSAGSGMVRFDPTRSDHVAKFKLKSEEKKLIEKPEKTKKKEKKKKQQNEKDKAADENSEAALLTNPEKFHKVADNLKERLRQAKGRAQRDAQADPTSSSSSFSLAALFTQTANLPEHVDDDDDKEDVPTYEKPFERGGPQWLKNAQGPVTGVDEDAEETGDNWKEDIVSSAKPATVRCAFTVTAENPEFQKLMEYFKQVRTGLGPAEDEADKAALTKWNEERNELRELVKKRVNQAKRAKKLLLPQRRHYGGESGTAGQGPSVALSSRDAKKHKKMMAKVTWLKRKSKKKRHAA